MIDADRRVLFELSGTGEGGLGGLSCAVDFFGPTSFVSGRSGIMLLTCIFKGGSIGIELSAKGVAVGLQAGNFKAKCVDRRASQINFGGQFIDPMLKFLRPAAHDLQRFLLGLALGLASGDVRLQLRSFGVQFAPRVCEFSGTGLQRGSRFRTRSGEGGFPKVRGHLRNRIRQGGRRRERGWIDNPCTQAFEPRFEVGTDGVGTPFLGVSFGDNYRDAFFDCVKVHNVAAPICPVPKKKLSLERAYRDYYSRK